MIYFICNLRQGRRRKVLYDWLQVSTGGVVSGVRLRRKKFQFFNRNKPM